MKKYEKEELQAYLDAEKKTLNELKKAYKEALDSVNEKIYVLESRTDIENEPSIIYQMKYQEMIKKQLEDIIRQLESKQYETVDSYLKECYNEAFTRNLYSLAKQDIPFAIPINQEDVVKAIRTDSKISTSLYSALGLDVDNFKRTISSEISRGIASSMTTDEIAKNLLNASSVPYNNAARIARTEGNRIRNQAKLDCMEKAVEMGADVYKQWDSTLDGKTRPVHRMLDGQLKRYGQKFEAGGYKVDAPLQFGVASEDVNCRCCLLQRAAWALDEDELKELQERAEYFGLDKSDEFEDYKKKYLKASQVLNAPNINDKVIKSAKEDFKEVLNNSDGIEKHVRKMNAYSEYTEYEENNDINAPFQYDAANDVIYYNKKAPNYEFYDLNYVQAHELSHRMDVLEYNSINNDEFLNAIDICKKRVLDNKEMIQTWFDEGGKYENDFAISDIISALSKNEISVPVGHEDNYWEKDKNNIPFELFANISSIDVIGTDSKAEFESLLKELYDAYRGIVE